VARTLLKKKKTYRLSSEGKMSFGQRKISWGPKRGKKGGKGKGLGSPVRTSGGIPRTSRGRRVLSAPEKGGGGLHKESNEAIEWHQALFPK